MFYKKHSGTKTCLKVHIWPASSGEARKCCINSKRHVVRQRVAHAKVVVAWREKRRQICQQAVTSVGGHPCGRCDRDAIYRGLWHQRCVIAFLLWLFYVHSHFSSEQTRFLNHDTKSLTITRAGFSACRVCRLMWCWECGHVCGLKPTSGFDPEFLTCSE